MARYCLNPAMAARPGPFEPAAWFNLPVAIAFASLRLAAVTPQVYRQISMVFQAPRVSREHELEIAPISPAIAPQKAQVSSANADTGWLLLVARRTQVSRRLAQLELL